MQKDQSPEEKLLSIIKGKPGKSGDRPHEPEIKGDKADAGAASKKIDDLLLMAMKSGFLKNIIIDPGILKAFNRYAAIIIVIFASYLVLDILLIRPSRKAASIISKAAVSKAPSPIAARSLPIETKNYSYHSNRIAGKNIFSPGSDLAGGAEEPAEAAPSIGLVGIVPGKNPQAIIEDTKGQKTYYLIKGQSVNGITIEDISEGKVVLDYRGKKMTLFL